MTAKKPILKKVDSALDISMATVKTLDSSASSSHTDAISRTKSPLNVKFESIQIRNYDITLGDNPSCNYGPPVSLDWGYDEMEPVSLDLYEDEKKHNPPRKMHQMHMLSRQRANLLKDSAGFTDDELNMVIDEMRKIQKERNMTKMGLPFQKIHEAAESAGRKWNRSRKNVIKS